jgi:hypothetical protein
VFISTAPVRSAPFARVHKILSSWVATFRETNATG